MAENANGLAIISDFGNERHQKLPPTNRAANVRGSRHYDAHLTSSPTARPFHLCCAETRIFCPISSNALVARD